MQFNLRCELCAIGWPDEKELYSPCPQCMELVEMKAGPPSITEGDAAALRAEALFGWWLLVTGRL